MPIVDQQRRLHEAGRIRIGEQVSSSGRTGTRPTKLETFRFTSRNEEAINKLAALYGGKAKPWKSPAGAQFEVVTETDHIPVLVPPAEIGLSQWMELWSGGGCKHRCDGNATPDGEPCDISDHENPQWKPHTRVNLMLTDIPT